MMIWGLSPFLVSDWQHLVDSGQAEGVRSSMDREVCAERSFQAAKWHPQGSFKLISQKGKESGSPLGRAFCPPVMTSSLTWHHLSWCRAPLDSTSSTSPDMKRSWNPQIMSKQGLHLRSQVALFGPIEHCAHPVICLSALSKPEMLFLGPHVMPVLLLNCLSKHFVSFICVFCILYLCILVPFHLSFYHSVF